MYTTALGWHETVNRELWSGAPSDAVVTFSEVLNGGLRKLQPYSSNERTVYRGYSASNIERFRAQYQVGTIVAFPAFTSASARIELAFGGNVLYTIRGLNARMIWFLAADFQEHEVLFPSGRRFRVLDNEQDGDDGDKVAVLSVEVL